MTTETQKRIPLSDKERLELIMAKFLPELTYHAQHWFQLGGKNESGVRHCISGMNVYELNPNQQAIVFNVLGEEHLRKARLAENLGLSTIARWNGFKAPAPEKCSEKENNHLNTMVDAITLFGCVMGLGGEGECTQPTPKKWVTGECENTPIYAFRDALTNYKDALGCFQAISPELRPAKLRANLLEDIIKRSQIIQIPDEVLRNWGYLFSNFAQYDKSKSYPDLKGFNGLKTIVYDEAKILFETTPKVTYEPALRTKDCFEKLKGAQKTSLELADKITISRQPKELDSQKAAMAFLYHRAGEKDLSKFLLGPTELAEIYNVCWDGKSIMILNRSPNIRVE